MLQVFYKEKAIIISDKKSDLKDSILIDIKLLEDLDLVKLLSKKKVNSIGIKSKKSEKVINIIKKKFPEIIAAGGKVYNDAAEVLFIYRDKKWDLPKGKVEKKENISQTALREVTEETGIKNLSITKPLEKTYHIFKRNNKYFLKTTYWFEMKTKFDGKLYPQEKEGITKVEWLDEKAAQKALENSYANIKLLV